MQRKLTKPLIKWGNNLTAPVSNYFSISKTVLQVKCRLKMNKAKAQTHDQAEWELIDFCKLCKIYFPSHYCISINNKGCKPYNCTRYSSAKREVFSFGWG